MIGKLIEEAIKEKYVLQKEITRLVQNYQDEYGVTIDRIEIDTVQSLVCKPFPLINLNVKL